MEIVQMKQFNYRIMEIAELFGHIINMYKKYIYELRNCKTPVEQLRKRMRKLSI